MEVPMRGRKSTLIVRTEGESPETLPGFLRCRKTPAGLAKRAWAMLLPADRQSFVGTARQAGLAERHIRKWAKRFVRRGVAELQDKPRPGRKPVFSPEVAIHLVKIDCERPDDEVARCRSGIARRWAASWSPTTW